MSFAFDHLVSLPFFLSCEILNHWLPIEQVAQLDTACCSSSKRQFLLKILSSKWFIQHDQILIPYGRRFAWYVARSIGATNLKVLTASDEKGRDAAYFSVWGKYVRKIHFTETAPRNQDLILMHCRKLVSVTFTDAKMGDTLRHILRCNPTLKEVAFHNFAISDGTLEGVTLPKLRMLQITARHSANKSLCHALSRLCDGLTHLRVSRVNLDEPDIILDMTARCKKQLICLDLSNTKVNSHTVSAIVHQCSHLMNLALQNCCFVNDASILCITLNLLNLRTLDIRNCSLLTGASLTHIGTYCAAQLVSFYLGNYNFSLSSVTALVRKCTLLHTFGYETENKYGHDYSNADVCELIQALSSIQRLHMRGEEIVCDDELVMDIAEYCKYLTHLALLPASDRQEKEYEYFTEDGLLDLQQKCHHLQRLIVYKECPLLQNELAIRIWEASRPGLKITSEDSIDYDVMKCDT